MSILDDFDAFTRRGRGSANLQQQIPPKVVSFEEKLFQASSRGRIALAAEILNQVEVVNPDVLVNGFNAAHIAAKKGYNEILEKIIAKDRRFLFSRTSDGRTCEMLAAFEGHLPVLKVLQTFSENSNHIVDERGNNSLHYAAWNGQFECLKFLVEDCGRDPNECNNDNIPPLQVAAAGNFSALVQYLLNIKQQSSESTSITGMNSLLRAASHGSIDTVQILVEQNPEIIRSKAENGSTSLHFAAKHGYYEVLSYLLEKEPSLVNDANNFQLTPLHYAALEGFLDCVMLLLSKGADPTLVSGEGETAFHLAAMQGKHEIARVLFEMSNEDIFAKDRSGRSLIDKTIENGFKELANNLVLWSYCQLRISTFPAI